MGKQESGSGGGVAVAVVMIAVLLAVPCLIAVLLGAFALVGVRSVAQPVILTPPPPMAVKAAVPMRAVVLTIGADSKMILDSVPVELAEIPDRVQQLRVANPNSTLQIMVRADAATPSAALTEAINSLSATGVNYLVEPPASGSPSGAPQMPQEPASPDGGAAAPEAGGESEP